MEHGTAHTQRTYLPPALALAAAALRSRAMADFCALPPPIVTVDDCNGRARTRQRDARQHPGQWFDRSMEQTQDTTSTSQQKSAPVDTHRVCTPRQHTRQAG